MIAGFAATVLILYNGIIDKPGKGPAEIGVSLDYGYWIALARRDRDLGRRLHPLARERRPQDAQGPGHRLAFRLVSVISQDQRSGEKPDRNLALELVRVTESAALAAARWVGRGEKESADGAAVDAMRLLLDTVPMDGLVVIGEGEKDEAPMLYNGERIGDGSPPEVDIAVDPLEGTTPDRPRHAVGALGDRPVRARDDVRPGAMRLHGEDRRQLGDRRRAQPRRAARRR